MPDNDVGLQESSRCPECGGQGSGSTFAGCPSCGRVEPRDAAQEPTLFDQRMQVVAGRLAHWLDIDEATAWNYLYPPNGALGALISDCPLCKGDGCHDCFDGKVLGP